LALIVTVSGSPSPASRTALIAREAGRRLAGAGFEVASIDVRDLPAEDLLQARTESPPIRDAAALLARAAGLVIATPVYKAAYSGLLKTFLDLLPQFGLAGKAVLPLATGGSMAHVLAIDYALRPVLASMGARQIVAGLFFLDKQLEKTEDGGLRIDPMLEGRFAELVDELGGTVRRLSTA
jgi:FMN reductase